MKTINLFFIVCSIAAITSCSPETDAINNGTNPGSSEWSIPQDEIFDGGPGKDGIPSIDSPQFINADEAGFLALSDRVLGYKQGDNIRAYPHSILNWHEIVNDEITGGEAIAINYCPLTGTGIAWNRTINGQTTTFGVSGLLYNSNLIAYDRVTDSNWSQMLLECVNGELRGEETETYQLLETTWETWKEMYPNTLVLSRETGFSRDYDRYPYGNYQTDHDRLLFPVNPLDERLPAKERVHGIIEGGTAKVYRFDSFPGHLTVHSDVFRNQQIVLAGSQDRQFIVSFSRKTQDETILNFEAAAEESHPSYILTDNEGNIWDISGQAVSGPREGEILTPTTSYLGFWFAWGAFYPGADIYQQ
ncbi:MAG: DUF3179 domain-containing protein [Bacteroidales bacterium]